MNKIELRDYQKDIIKRAIKAKGNILIQAPTGSGKTLIAEEIVKFHKDDNKKSLFLAPKINLLEQTASAFKNLNPQIIHGSNKEDIDLNAHSFVSTIQTISRRVEFLSSMNFDYIIFDEMHYGAKGKMQEIIKSVHKGKIIGLSATPYDEEGKLLTEDFDVIIDDYNSKYMVDNGYLVNIKSYESYKPNLNGIKTKVGDWDLNELDNRFNKPEIVNKIVAATKDILNTRYKTIVFCINISHAEAICKAYKNIGFNCEVIHSNLNKKEQKEILNRYINKETKILVSVDQLTTGFDVPATDTIVIARPTQSQNLYKQIIGRALRLSKETNKEEALLLDCGGVIERLGMPLDSIKEKVKQFDIVKKPYCCKSCKSVKPRIFKIINDNKETITICPDCKESIKFKPKFIYKCDSCNRYYDFKNDFKNFSFENEEMNLNCLCGYKNKLGSLNDDEVSFRELTIKSIEEFNIERLNSKDISEESLEELSEEESFTIRNLIFKHKNTNTKTLIKMAKDNFSADTEHFLDNKKITKENLLEIIEYKKNDIHADGIYIGRYGSMLLEIITHKKCTKEILNSILEHKDRELIKCIIKRVKSVIIENIPKKHYLENQKYKEIRLEDKVVNNVELFLGLAAKKEEYRFDVARNKYISLKLLKEFANDKDENIRRIIFANPNFNNSMLEIDLSNSDNVSKPIYKFERKGLTKEIQLELMEKGKDSLKIEILKHYKSKDVYIKCIETLDFTTIESDDYWDKIQKRDLLILIIKSNHYDSKIKNFLIERYKEQIDIEEFLLKHANNKSDKEYIKRKLLF